MPLLFVRNDIAKMRCDAIVNAANASLLGGGGVDGAIHRAAGPGLLEECRTLGGCLTGDAKVTKAYDLHAKIVIHTVGPVWEGGDHGERGLLESCYRRSLELAEARGCDSVAFPLISAGAYGYPPDKAFDVAVRTIRKFLDTSDMTVYLVLFGVPDFLRNDPIIREMESFIDDAYVAANLDRDRERSRRMYWQLRAERPVSAPEEGSFGHPHPPFSDACEDAPEPEPMPEAEIVSASDTQEQRAILHAPRMKRPPKQLKPQSAAKDPDWDEILRKADKGFSETLLEMIDAKGITDAQCYRRANVDRRLFSKIRSNPAYRPGKALVFAFAVALRLSPEETEKLLNRAGFALSESSAFDLILKHFILNGIYDIDRINIVLCKYDLPLLGSGMRESA